MGGWSTIRWNFQKGGEASTATLKWKVRRCVCVCVCGGGGVVVYEIPSVVGVWIFSKTTHLIFVQFTFCYYLWLHSFI